MIKYSIIVFLFVFNITKLKAQEDLYQVSKSVTINLVELEELNKLIFDSEKTYKIVYIFDQYCPTNRDVFPQLNNLYRKANQENFELFVVSNTKEKNKEKLRDHLFYYGYEESFFIIKDKPFLGFYKKLVSTICESCNAKEMGYSDFIVFNKNNEVIEQTKYSQTREEHIAILKKYIQ